MLNSGNENLIDRIMNNLKNVYTHDSSFLEFVKQFEILGSINEANRVYENECVKKLNRNVQADRQVYSLLLVLSKKIEKNPCKNINQKYYDYNENIISGVSTALKFIMYKTSDFEYGGEIEEQGYVEIDNFIDFANIDQFIKDLNDIWRFGNIDIERKENHIVLREKGSFGKSLRISQTNFLDIRNAKMNRHHVEYRFCKNKYDFEKTDQEIVYKLVEEYFYTKNFEQEYDGIKLKDWVKAYIAIRKYANDNLNHSTILKCENEWGKLLINSGVSRNSANKIIKHLIFDINSTDLFDCPFVRFDKGIALSTYGAAIINPSRSILSLLSKNIIKNSKINQKGTNFEELLKKVLTEKGFESINLEKDNHELDIVFKINEDVFIIEAKTMNQPISHWEFFRYQEEVNDYIKKFKRNYEYFCDGEGRKDLNSRLKIGKTATIYKVFVSNVLDTRSKIGEVYITNDTLFEGYFLRTAPCAYKLEGNVMIKIPLFQTDAYFGDYSSQQFIDLIESNLFSKKNEERIITENIRLPYNVKENNRSYVAELIRYTFKELDENDIIPKKY